jgi:predicted transcriptional regulator of viral defense system
MFNMQKIEEILLKDITFNGIDIFTKSELLSISSLDRISTEEALRYLNKSDIINTIERGKYCKFDFREELVIGNFLGRDGGIGYWTAMHFHGFTEQIPNTTFVQTSYKKQSKQIFGVKYKFVQIKKEKLIGFQNIGYGNHQYKITDKEKTIIDCFDLPQHSGGYAEIIKAFSNADLNARKMVRYCKAVNNIAVVKRLAYLSELLNKPNMEYFTKYAQSVKNEKYNVFEVGGEKKGKSNSRWNLILNIDENEIMEIANS